MRKGYQIQDLHEPRHETQIRKSFGSLESLEEATGLPEYQLLPMTMKLLNEQMDMFMTKILYDYTIKILMKSIS